MNEPNPFLDPDRQRELYGHASRLSGRTSALMRAKTAGRPVPETIVSLVQTRHARPGRLGVVLDIGCGRGTSSLVIAEQLRPQRVVGLDAAPTPAGWLWKYVTSYQRRVWPTTRDEWFDAVEAFHTAITTELTDEFGDGQAWLDTDHRIIVRAEHNYGDAQDAILDLLNDDTRIRQLLATHCSTV